MTITTDKSFFFEKEVWQNSGILVFLADDGTIFHRGPFDIEGIKYDFKFVDKFGEDYCTNRQMERWNVKIQEVIKKKTG